MELNSAAGEQAEGCRVFSRLTADGVVSKVNRLDTGGLPSAFIGLVTSRDASIYFPLTLGGRSRTALDEQ